MDKKIMIPSYLASAGAGILYSLETLSGEQFLTGTLASYPVVQTLFALLIFVGSAATVYGGLSWIKGGS
jgi:hypothetical protein